MPLYMILSSLTDEGAKTLKTRPERVKEVNAELEKLGVRVLQQYAVLGAYDFLNIVEAPDEKTVARAMVELVSRGTIKTMTLPIIPIDEFLEKLK
jgi:uncharacterized protein with GYD domain